MQQSERPALGRAIVGSAGLFCLGFVAVALLLHLTLRNPLYLHADVRSEKLLLLERLQGTVYSAVFGSSHLHNGFDPRTFDAALAGSPAQTHTVNLAIEGGSQAEQRTMAAEFLHHLVAPTHPDACMVMLELTAGANFASDHLVHPRSINIYDWRTARFVAELTDTHMSLTERAGRIGFAVAAAGLHYMNVGMLSNHIFAPPMDQKALSYESEDDRRGLKVEPYNASFEPRLYHEVQGEPAHPALTPGELTDGNTALIEQLQQESPVKNLQFLYVVYPKISDMAQEDTFPDHLEAGGETVPIIDLARPDRFPQLYNPELWHDDAHFNGHGAAVVSQVLGEQVKAWYAAHGGPPRCEAR